jgi:hypothetical protein
VLSSQDIRIVGYKPQSSIYQDHNSFLKAIIGTKVALSYLIPTTNYEVEKVGVCYRRKTED